MEDKIYEVRDFPLTEENLGLQETIFFNGNGYLGVRGNLEEGLPEDMDTMRGTYINGFYDMVPMKQAELLHNLVEDKEAIVNIADTQTILADFGGEAFSLFRGNVSGLVRRLNMSDGISCRELDWTSPSGGKFHFDIRRMASFSERSLFVIDFRVTSEDYEGPAEFLSLHKGVVHNYSNPHDPRMAAESGEHILPKEGHVSGGTSVLISRTASTGLEVASAVTCEVYVNGKKAGPWICEYDEEAHEARTRIAADLKPGCEIRIVKYCIFTDSRRSDDCGAEAGQKMNLVLQNGVDSYYQAQRQFLDQFWNSAKLQIDGDEDLNRAVSFNMYALLQSACPDGTASIAAKGLSGEGYEGHYFWDTEMFMLPFFILTAPQEAKNLLSYRYRTLPQARENARLLGHKRGALYPWRTITGRECSGYYPSGSAAYHINGDIAYAVISYYLATGDLSFMEKEGYEILLETARIWTDMGNWYQGSFRILCVTGPDEYTCMVNNNYFTNCAAKYNLEWTVKMADILRHTQGWKDLAARLAITDDELAGMKRAADGMYLPYDEEWGINPQDDSFLQKPVWNLPDTPASDFPLLLHYHPLHLYRYQVCKQADTVLAHVLFPQYQDEETMRKSFLYYEKITTHDSSLSTCVFSIKASELGMRDKAVWYMGDSAKMDLLNTHHNSKDGIHAANMGGSYMAIINGIALLRIHEGYVSLSPWIPEQWHGYCFRFLFHGSLFEVTVKQGESELRMLSGQPVMVQFYDRKEQMKEGSLLKHTCG